MRKTLYIIILLISVLLTIAYLVGQEEVAVAKVKVEITKGSPFSAERFNDSERDELIGNISISRIYVRKLAEPKGNNMYMPGISVGLFSNKMMISEWTSVPIKDKGVYEVILGLNQPLQEGDDIRIAVYVNDDKGKVIIGKRKDGWD